MKISESALEFFARKLITFNVFFSDPSPRASNGTNSKSMFFFSFRLFLAKNMKIKFAQPVHINRSKTHCLQGPCCKIRDWS